MTTPSRPPNERQSAATATPSRALPAGLTAASNPHQNMQPPINPNPQSHAGDTRSLPLNNHEQSSTDTNHLASPGISPQRRAPQPPHQQPLPSNAPQQHPPARFYSARAATDINSETHPANIPKFDPHAASTSIRKTAGIDYNKTIPVKRSLTGVPVAAPPAVKEGVVQRSNPPRDFVNPSTDMHRRIGAPGMQSPGGMTGSAYKPPTRRGPEPSFAGGMAAQNNSNIRRVPLGDVSNLQQSTTGTSDGSDTKRQRVIGPENGTEGNHAANAR